MTSPKNLLIPLLASLWTGLSATAAPTDIVPAGPGDALAWGPAIGFNDDPSQVSTAGTHHAAVRFGNSDLIVNGVNFSRHTGAGGFANGAPITTTAPTVASGGTGGTGNYGALVSSGGFHSSTTSPNVTINGLTVGRLYQVQLFMPYWDVAWPTQFGTTGASGVVLNCGLNTTAPGVCTGTFRALAGSHAINWSRVPPNTFALLSAVSVRLLDESVLKIAENNSPGASVASLVALDSNAGQTHTFSLVGGAGSADNTSFSIVGTTLTINPVADFEAKSSYSIRIQADDGAGGVFSKAFTVSILDVPEFPEIVVEEPPLTALTSGISTVSLGTWPRGTASTARTFTIRNTGLAPLAIGTVSLTGGNVGDFSVDMTGMAGSVPPGGSTTFTVSCTPSALGNRATTLLVVNNDGDEYYTQIGLTATGIPRVPTLINPMFARLTSQTADLGANVISDDGAEITERGVVLSLTSSNGNPVIGGPGVVKIATTGTTGAFWIPVGNLAPSANYTFKAYATNSTGTSYTNPRAFATPMAAGRIEMLSTNGKPYGGTVTTWGDHSFGQISGNPADPDIVAITSGARHGVALRRDGTVHAWGDNGYAGQTNVPAGLNNVVAISAGAFFTLALKGDGTVVRWGKESDPGLTPPPGLGGVIAIAAGDGHGLALKNDGTVVEWPSPGSVPAHLSGVVGIAAGLGHSLALLGDGTVVGWGNNNGGQATPPAGLADVVAIAARGTSSLALQANGFIAAWGSNSAIPPGVSNVAGLGTGEGASMVYTRTGGFIGWGDNTDGKITPPAGLSHVIGIAGGSYHTSVMRRELPFGVVGLDSTSPSTTFVIRNGGDSALQIQQMQLLGNNPSDFLVDVVPAKTPLLPGEQSSVLVNFRPSGVGTRSVVLRIKTNDPERPDFDILLTGTGVVQAPLISDPTVTAVTHRGAVLGATVTRAGGSPVTRRGVVLSLTSRNAAPVIGAVGVMTLTTGAGLGNFTLPTSSLLMNRQYAMRGFVTNAAGTRYTAPVIFTTRQTALADLKIEHPAGTPVASPVIGRGYNDIARFDPLPLLPGIIALGAGDSHTLALTQAGQVIGWGDNMQGQIDIPEEAIDIIAISAGSGHSLALNRSGVVFAWGRDWENQSVVPTDLGSDIIAISAGRFHNLALHADGTVSGWGGDWAGQATPPAGLTGVMAISAGGSVSAALKNDGTVVTWGSGLGSSIEPPSGLSGVTAIAAGLGHFLALRNDGTVVGWGHNDYGQANVPAGLADVVAVDADFDYSLARLADGRVVAWGSPDFGKLAIPPGQTGYQMMAGGPYHSLTVDSMVDFGDAVMGAATETKSFTIRNTGNASLLIHSVSILGSHPGDFSGTQPAVATIPPGGVTTVGVTFAPSSTGYRAAVLRVLSNDPDEGTMDISLKGTGVIGPPNVLTGSASHVTTTGATLGGSVTGDGGDVVTERGVVYSTAAGNGNPFIGGAGVTKVALSGGLGPFAVDVSGLAPGTAYVFKSYAANGHGTTYGASTLFAVGATYSAWAASQFGGAGAQTGPADDFDKDGIRNLMEFALGLNPVAPGALPVRQDFAPGGYLRLTIERGNLGPGIIYRVEASDDLVEWSDQNLVVEEDTPARLVVRDHTPRTAGGRRFLRLRVEF